VLNDKTRHVLDALAKEQQPAASEYLSTLMYVPGRSTCEEKRDEFALRFKKTDAHGLCRIVGPIFFGKEHLQAILLCKPWQR
jgi:hypothetical protein